MVRSYQLGLLRSNSKQAYPVIPSAAFLVLRCMFFFHGGGDKNISETEKGPHKYME